MFDEVGKSIAANIGRGFKEAMQKVAHDMNASLPSDFYTNANVNVSADSRRGTNITSGSPLFTIQQMIVRSEDDIRRVSQELRKLIDTGERSQGIVTTP
jgi:hypothetical protein